VDNSAEGALKKRKREAEKAQDPKLKEYMTLMQSGKTRTWANDDTMAAPSADSTPVINQPTQDNSVAEEVPSQPKKARIEESLPVASTQEPEPEPMAVEQSEEDGNEDTSAQEDTPAQDGQGEEEAAPASDMDWLRSKTSRLLGLLDEDEQAEFEERKVDKPVESRSSPMDESRSAAIEQITSQPEPEPVTNVDETVDEPADEEEKETEISPEQAKNIELIRDSARLFLRNLSYDLKEADLHPLFSPFGKIEEVSSWFHSLPITSFHYASTFFYRT
jgi:multiple RNA-binding domain-containing protein 1